MHHLYSILLLCASAPLLLAAPAVTSSCASYVPVPTPPAKLHCGQKGTLPKPAPLSSSTYPKTSKACELACLDNPACISFGFDSSAKKCTFYKKTLDAQGFMQGPGSTVYHNRRCFKCKATTTTTSSTSTSTSTSSSPPPCSSTLSSNYVANGNFLEHNGYSASDWDASANGIGYGEDFSDPGANGASRFDGTLVGLESGSSGSAYVHLFQMLTDLVDGAAYNVSFYTANYRNSNTNCVGIVSLGSSSANFPILTDDDPNSSTFVQQGPFLLTYDASSPAELEFTIDCDETSSTGDTAVPFSGVSLTNYTCY